MNNLTRMPSQQVIDPAQQWFWNGSQWVCGCDPDCPPPFPGPPPFFPPPQGQPPWYPGANGGVFFSTTAPANPIRGAFWWDGTVLWLFDGAAWVDVGMENISGGGTSGSGAGTVVISTTPPGNPATGSQWWDGSVLRMWNGTSWVVIGPGQGAGPVPTTTLQFSITQSTSVSLGSTSNWTICPFTTTPQSDPQAGYDPATHKWKPVKAGYYVANIRGYINGSGGGVAVLKNDDGNFTTALGPGSETIIAISTTTTGWWMSSSGFALMNGATDYLRLWVWDGTGTFLGANNNPVMTTTLLP